MTLKTFDLTGRRALVTGSGSGIGLAYAEGLAGAGAEVILNGRDKTKLDAAEKALKAKGFKVATSAFDVTDPAAVNAGIDAIEATRGPIDILVNNAGMTIREKLEDFADADWRRVMATNIDSVFYVSKAAARHMLKRGYGKIINTCSVMSELGRPSIAPYTASKGAVKMMTKQMAVEWGARGIRSNGIAPGYFKTELTDALVKDPAFSAWVGTRTPLGRWGNVEELQGACVFLAAPASDYVTGHVLFVDGGLTASV
ncbi:MAG: glucose 1-dehydrogenase [Phreatobacter sp.]|uniref:glucose 1-dehydrogenase n=1 Tax=Phreatobacter sp. TaxID=1966341 RepID=UPI001A5244EC|nr:glucose 1-dehydrogenase [Phreatobacter sp.]MBL8570917.1 glucose 1-dehydrogenase [Phreatobacter sp.]